MVRSTVLFCIVIVASLMSACGAKEDSKEEQAEEFYDEKLHTDDQKACNAKGFIYDALETKCMEVEGFKVSTWTCDRTGLTGRLTEKGTLELEATTMTELDAFLADGYEFHQCGENDAATIYLIIVNKGMTDKQATLEIRRTGFAIPTPVEE